MGIDMEDISVHFVDFHGTGIDEQVILNQDGSYTILIDARASYEAQAEAYEHAMSHIREMDFQKNDVQLIESESHGIKCATPVSDISVIKPLHRKRKFSRKAHDDIDRKLQEIQDLCDIIGVDLNDYLFRRAEEKKLYGGL